VTEEVRGLVLAGRAVAKVSAVQIRLLGDKAIPHARAFEPAAR